MGRLACFVFASSGFFALAIATEMFAEKFDYSIAGCRTVSSAEAADLVVGAMNQRCPIGANTVGCPGGSSTNPGVDTCSSQSGTACASKGECYYCSAVSTTQYHDCVSFPEVECTPNDSGITPCGSVGDGGCKFANGTCTCDTLPATTSGDCPKSDCS